MLKKTFIVPGPGADSVDNKSGASVLHITKLLVSNTFSFIRYSIFNVKFDRSDKRMNDVSPEIVCLRR